MDTQPVRHSYRYDRLRDVRPFCSGVDHDRDTPRLVTRNVLPPLGFIDKTVVHRSIRRTPHGTNQITTVQSVSIRRHRPNHIHDRWTIHYDVCYPITYKKIRGSSRREEGRRRRETGDPPTGDGTSKPVTFRGHLVSRPLSSTHK